MADISATALGRDISSRLLHVYTLFVIDLASRRVRILGTTPRPDEAFMRQIVRTLTMADADM